MEKKSFGISEKNIPISKKQEHNIQTIFRSEKLVRRMRWDAHFELNPSEKGTRKDTFGIPSQRKAPSVPELKEFEKQLHNLVSNIQYKESAKSTDFQRKIHKEIQEIRGDQRLFVPADKSSNYYKMAPATYQALLAKAVHKDFKKAKEGEEQQIAREARDIANSLEIGDRVFQTELKPAKVTVKDHKEDFMNKTQTRMINPTKPNLGKVAKVKLERLVRLVKGKTKLKQWQNTDATLVWFNALDNKQSLSFIVCDIVDYYPSISAELLDRALNWSSHFATISEDDRALFHHTRNSILFHEGSLWIKKGERNFDIAQGSWDGAEVTDLVGLYLLSKLQHLDEMNSGLYRDDMLGVTQLQGKDAERLKQKIIKVFQDESLTVKIEVNKKVVDYLNVTLSLLDGTHRDYMKPGQVLNYVHQHSNHPPVVTKSITEGIAYRLSVNSSNQALFDDAKKPYEEALKRSGLNHNLVYKPEVAGGSAPKRRRRRRNNVIWFNPPWCNSVTTDIGRQFLRIVDSCFPPGHQLHKIFNRRTIKVSYSTMPNLGRIVSSHNTRVLKSLNPVQPKRPWGNCSCPKRKRDANECPLAGQCIEEQVVYQATVKVNVDDGAPAVPDQTYLGITEPEWKLRHGNHKQDFKKVSQRGRTCLSKYIWSLKDKGLVEERDYNITWALVSKASSFSPTSGQCRLCLQEKSLLVLKPHLGTLNDREEFFCHCRHKEKLLLQAVK